MSKQWLQNRPRAGKTPMTVVYDGKDGVREIKRFEDGMSSACRKFYRDRMNEGRNPTLRKPEDD